MKVTKAALWAVLRATKIDAASGGDGVLFEHDKMIATDNARLHIARAIEPDKPRRAYWLHWRDVTELWRIASRREPIRLIDVDDRIQATGGKFGDEPSYFTPNHAPVGDVGYAVDPSVFPDWRSVIKRDQTPDTEAHFDGRYIAEAIESAHSVERAAANPGHVRDSSVKIEMGPPWKPMCIRSSGGEFAAWVMPMRAWPPERSAED